MGRKAGLNKPTMRAIDPKAKLSGAQRKSTIWQPKGTIVPGRRHTGGRGRDRGRP